MTYKKMPPVKGGHKPCLCCGFDHEILPVKHKICVGFGFAALMKNNEIIWSEKSGMEWKDIMSVEKAESIAAEDPDNDWRIHLEGPLSEVHYQRQGKNHWVLYEKGKGFA